MSNGEAAVIEAVAYADSTRVTARVSSGEAGWGAQIIYGARLVTKQLGVWPTRAEAINAAEAYMVRRLNRPVGALFGWAAAK